MGDGLKVTIGGFINTKLEQNQFYWTPSKTRKPYLKIGLIRVGRPRSKSYSFMVVVGHLLTMVFISDMSKKMVHCKWMPTIAGYRHYSGLLVVRLTTSLLTEKTHDVIAVSIHHE